MLPVRSRRRKKRCFFPIYRTCPISQIYATIPRDYMCVSRLDHDLINKNKVSSQKSLPPSTPGKLLQTPRFPHKGDSRKPLSWLRTYSLIDCARAFFAWVGSGGGHRGLMGEDLIPGVGKQKDSLAGNFRHSGRPRGPGGTRRK